MRRITYLQGSAHSTIPLKGTVDPISGAIKPIQNLLFLVWCLSRNSAKQRVSTLGKSKIELESYILSQIYDS